MAGGLALADFVRTIEDVDAKIGHNFFDRPEPRLSPNVGTPLGQFTPANLGGTPVPVKLVEGGGAFNAIEAAIKNQRDAVRKALKEDDIHAARIAQKQLDSLNKLRGEVGDRINDIIPHLGKVNTALSVANRNLEQGNARQRELAQGIREARDRIGSGFQASPMSSCAPSAPRTSAPTSTSVPSQHQGVGQRRHPRRGARLHRRHRRRLRTWATVTAQLLVRQGGGAADEVDIANLPGLPDREGVPFFDHNTSLIIMGQRWEQGTAALGSFMYIDPHATHTHQFRPHASVKLVETASGDDDIIA